MVDGKLVSERRWAFVYSCFMVIEEFRDELWMTFQIYGNATTSLGMTRALVSDESALNYSTPTQQDKRTDRKH